METNRKRRVFNRTQASDYLGIDRHTLVRYEKRGIGPMLICTDPPLYSEKTLDAWLSPSEGGAS